MTAKHNPLIMYHWNTEESLSHIHISINSEKHFQKNHKLQVSMSFCSLLGPKNVTLVTSTFIYFSIIMTNGSFFTFKPDESVLHGQPASDRWICSHQVVKAKKYNFLLVLQVFVGLSFPFEGPAPLEALANGCVFLNPRLNPPQSRLNSEFFKEKPNIREVWGLIQRWTVLNPLNNHAFLYYAGFRCHFYQI